MHRKDWTRIFKGLGNENRLKIIQLLYPRKKINVSEIRKKLGISYRWTSRNLVDLEKIGVLRNKGTKGQVLYFINPELPVSLHRIIKEFI